jgi:molybdate transport system substrate-binding protein
MSGADRWDKRGCVRMCASVLSGLLSLSLILGCGAAGSDPAGSGPAGSGPAGSNPAGSNLAGSGPDRSGPVADSIIVAAASDLRPAFEKLGTAFTEQTGIEVTFSFGSSGLLREQIINGAPFDLFASANVDYVDQVVMAGRGRSETVARYGIGRIVLWVPAGSELPDSIIDLTDPRFRRIVIANPQHAPYGLAAAQALSAAGVAEAVQDKLVYAENVSDAMRIVESGNAEVGIIALSLAIAVGPRYQLIPSDLHAPLDQGLVVTSDGAKGAAAQAFAVFIGSPTGREMMSRYGFVAVGE